MQPLIFQPPEPASARPRVHPVFLAYQGCPFHCVFCAQPLQTGEMPRALPAVLEDCDAVLAAQDVPEELAFYGGTFTALPEEDQTACLALAAKYRARGIVAGVRASTRPDALTAEGLFRLSKAGLGMLELGVQSFADRALKVSRRGYDGDTAKRGCEMVTNSGLRLGIQLMPGMPGMEAEDFLHDVVTALSFTPAALRLYPCLVLAGTGLAELHTRGEYAPWSLEKTIPLLADAQLAAWKAGVPVIRMGLAPQDGLDRGGVLAGPYHPALGSMARGLALFRYISDELSRLGRPVKRLGLPRRFQGEFWGHGGELKSAYAALGLTRESVIWWDAEHCEAC